MAVSGVFRVLVAICTVITNDKIKYDYNIDIHVCDSNQHSDSPKQVYRGSLYGRARTKTFRLIDIKCVLYVLPSW